VLVGALTALPDADLSAADLDKVLDRLPAFQRPRYVQVVPSIALTTWHRPIWRDLQRKGVPKPARGRRVWKLSDGGAHYEELKPPRPRKKTF
jgi:putative long chain acyl-CoA synthase